MTQHSAPTDGTKTFQKLLVNTMLANTTTSFLWFSLVFWVYLETRSVMVTAMLGGTYMLLLAVLGVPLGTLVDRHKKWNVAAVAACITTAAFLLAGVLFLVLPTDQLLDWRSWQFWLFSIVILIGAVVESVRNLVMSTAVTLLVPAEGRAQANGWVGMVGGLAMAVNSVLSGLAVGYLGMGWVVVISVALTALTTLHFFGSIKIPEDHIEHSDALPQKVDFKGAWLAIRAVPGLLALIFLTTFNNLLSGTFMALLDPYGLTLVSVQAWGIMFGVLSFGFILGGAAVAKWGLGSNPVRSILLANLALWVIAGTFTIRESVVFLVIGILLWMALFPVIEAGEQTVLQTVVPYEKQGRVFGFAQSLESAAAPITAFLIGPIAEYWLIPFMNGEGGQQLEWLLGTGEARGIALVFLITGILGFVLTLGAFFTKSYRLLSGSYQDHLATEKAESA